MGTMVMGITVPRSEVKEIEEPKGWVLVFGRRKTGKTFLVRKLMRHDYYFFVTRGGEIFDATGEGIEILSYQAFRERIRRLIEKRAVIVIDEFQRLPGEFLDFLHFLKPSARAKLVLVGSSMLVARKVLSTRSPLLGIVKPVRVGLIRPADIFATLSRAVEPAKALKLSPLLRDPWILEYVDIKAPLEEVIDQVVEAVRYACRGIVGEVFLEEDRELTERYEAVLRAIALGNQTPGQVASHLSGIWGNTIKSQDVKKYIANLAEMGLVKRYRIYQRKRFIYKINSPLLDLFYYLDSKLGFYELDVPQNLTREKALTKIPLYFEDFAVELLAHLMGAEPQKSFKPELDGILVKSGKPVAAVEVKFGEATRRDAYKLLEKTQHLKCQNIIVAEKGETIEEVKLLTPNEILKAIYEKKPCISRSTNTANHSPN